MNMTTATLERAPAVKVTRCKDWPNGLGFDCTVNGVRFQVTSDRAIGRLVALRENDEHEITHSIRICDDRSASWIDGSRNIADLVYRMWRHRREDWTSHEDR